VFDPSLRRRAHQRLGNETALRAALDDGSLGVAYQPIVSLTTGRVVAVEALARWNHPTRGPVSPEEFVPLAEETGVIHAMGQRILEVACRQARSWQRIVGHDTGGGALGMSVNVSGVQLDVDGFPETIAAALAAAGLEPECLTLELTESVVMDDVPGIVESLQAIAALGVRLAVDDLGRGWSSLAYLSRFPLSELKIDRSFVQGVARRPGDRAVVRSLVGLAHDLGLLVVAEGVEDGDQLAELTRLGCDAGQGFYLHRPQSASEIVELLAGGEQLRSASGLRRARR
jgi:EAL domain-containing protein (putative c-di-GMP-specific phosphodiesterase class I)